MTMYKLKLTYSNTRWLQAVQQPPSEGTTLLQLQLLQLPKLMSTEWVFQMRCVKWLQIDCHNSTGLMHLLQSMDVYQLYLTLLFSQPHMYMHIVKLTKYWIVFFFVYEEQHACIIYTETVGQLSVTVTVTVSPTPLATRLCFTALPN